LDFAEDVGEVDVCGLFGGADGSGAGYPECFEADAWRERVADVVAVEGERCEQGGDGGAGGSRLGESKRVSPRTMLLMSVTARSSGSRAAGERIGRGGFALSRFGYPNADERSRMARVSQSVEVGVSVRVAYNQWTQFELFPQFMEGIEQVTQLDDTRLRWVADIGGKRHEWDAEITEQTPDTRIAWRSVDGYHNEGVVTFEKIGPDVTRINVEFEYEPEGLVEKTGSAIGADDLQVEQDLARFKALVEQTGGAAEGWRGEVHEGRPEPARSAKTSPLGQDTVTKPSTEGA